MLKGPGFKGTVSVMDIRSAGASTCGCPHPPRVAKEGMEEDQVKIARLQAAQLPSQGRAEKEVAGFLHPPEPPTGEVGHRQAVHHHRLATGDRQISGAVGIGGIGGKPVA